jgi:hypothetical protein
MIDISVRGWTGREWRIMLLAGLILMISLF